MTVYLINIALILFWRLFFAWKKSPDAGKLYCGIVALQWILISGLRSWKIGADTVQYFSRFEAIKQTAWGRILRNLFAYLFRGGNGKDPGYDLITKVFQLFSKVGRFDVDDLILNTSGVILGYLIFGVCNAMRRRYGAKRKRS